MKRFSGGTWTHSLNTLKANGSTIISRFYLLDRAGFYLFHHVDYSPPLTCAYLGSAAKSLEYLVSRWCLGWSIRPLDPSGMKLSLRFSLFPASISLAFLDSSAASTGSLA